MYPSHDMLLHREKLINEILLKERRVKEVAQILGVKRETVSRWVAKYRFEGLDGICPKKPGPKKGSTVVNRTSGAVEELVCRYARDHVFTGPVGLSDLIEEEKGFRLHPTTVYRILKRQQVRYGLSYKGLKRKRKAYALEEPGEEVQLDVCFPFGYARKERVFDAIDDCSRFVFGRVMSGHTQVEAIAFVDALILAMPFTIKAIRTDCGREFGKTFTAHLQELDIEHRKNPPYTPQHNGKIERYHRTFKEKEAYSWPFYASVDELNYRLTLWLQQYNFKRKHGGLHMNRLTPTQKILYASFHKPLQPYLENVTGTLQLNST